MNALFLQVNRSQANVLDILTRRGAGKYYAFSDLSTFLGLHAIAALEGPNYTSSVVADRSIGTWMDDIATSWTELAQSAPMPGYPGMVDYGPSPNNFLECVPTYVHAVAALQAGNTWMMRETAKVMEGAGNASRAAALTGMANLTRDATLALFVKGTAGDPGGYFQAGYPGGQRVAVRTCVDFLTVANAMPQDVDQSMGAEMAEFAKRELLTPGWMRALSLKDAAAAQSDRADHGPRGTWDGWVGLTARALGTLGDYTAALKLVRAAAGVLDEGPYGQAHRVYGDNNTKMMQPPRKGGDQAYYAICGSTIAGAVIRSLFGFNPPVSERVSDASPPTYVLQSPEAARGFDGVLRNVRYRGRLYDIHSEASSGLSILPAAAGADRPAN